MKNFNNRSVYCLLTAKECRCRCNCTCTYQLKTKQYSALPYHYSSVHPTSMVVITTQQASIKVIVRTMLYKISLISERKPRACTSLTKNNARPGLFVDSTEDIMPGAYYYRCSYDCRINIQSLMPNRRELRVFR